MMMINVAAWIAVEIDRVYESPTTTGAGNLFSGLGSFAMEGHVAMTTESNAIGKLIPEVGIIRIRFDVVCCKTTLVLLALSMALLADIAVSFKNSFAPGKVLWVFKSLPRATTFPFVVSFAVKNSTIAKFGLKLLGFGRIRHSSPFCLSGYFGAGLF
jgi:hypothetical protein